MAPPEPPVWDDFRIDKIVGLIFLLFLCISVAAGKGAHALAMRYVSPLIASVLAIAVVLGVFAGTFKWNLRISAWIKSKRRK